MTVEKRIIRCMGALCLKKSSLDRIATVTCRRHVMFIESGRFLISSAKSEMLGISLFAEMMRGNRVAIDISPLCGDDSVHTLQRTNEGLLRQSRMGGQTRLERKCS